MNPNPNLNPPPRDPWYRRHWTRYNRPYTGCGCLYAIIIVFIIWWIIAAVWYPGRGWWWW